MSFVLNYIVKLYWLLIAYRVLFIIIIITSSSSSSSSGSSTRLAI